MADTPEATDVGREIIAPFHMMWNNFPHSVMRLKKIHEIVATNTTEQD